MSLLPPEIIVFQMHIEIRVNLFRFDPEIQMKRVEIPDATETSYILRVLSFERPIKFYQIWFSTVLIIRAFLW